MNRNEIITLSGKSIKKEEMKLINILFQKKTDISLFQPLEKNDEQNLVIDFITFNNLNLSVNIFNKYHDSFSSEEFFYIDKKIKMMIIYELNKHEGTITDNLKDILETFPFLTTGNNHYNNGSYEILRLSSLFNSDSLIQLCSVKKLEKSQIIPFLNYLFFDIQKTNYKNKDLPYQNLQFLLDQYIDKDIYIPNLMKTINISIKEDYDFNYRHYLSVLMKHFNIESFNEPFGQSCDLNKNIKTLHYLLENNFSPKKIDNDILINYIINISQKDKVKNLKLSYKPDCILTVLKKLSISDISSYFDINQAFHQNNYFYLLNNELFNKDKNNKKENDRNLAESHKLISYLLKNKLYPNTQIQFINDISDIFNFELQDQFKDKVIFNKTKKIADNYPFFACFILNACYKEQLDFYNQKNNFYADFYKARNDEFIKTLLSKFTDEVTNDFYEVIQPFFERFQILESLSQENDSDIPKSKKRL